jgi:GNAT superfamily N-acetyltransferase
MFDFGMDIVIRTATPEDAEALAALATRTFSETYAAHNTPEDMALHLATWFGPSQQRRELDDPSMATIVAVADGRFAGYAQLRSQDTPACITGEKPIEVQRFYVAREWHGRGVAHVLMQAAKVEAARRGGRTLWLGVWDRNERAKAFYGKQGFRDVGSQTFLLGTDRQTDRVLVVPLTMIRDMTDADAEGVAPLLGELGYAVDPAAIPARLDAVRHEGGQAFVALGDADDVLGVLVVTSHAVLHASGPVAMITALVVAQSARGKGVGRQLVDAAKAWAIQRGCVRLIVTSGEQRADAHAFYPATGLPYTGRRFGVTLKR